MKAGIVVFPGTNREGDMRLALEQATGYTPAMLWHKDTVLPALDLLVVPGGFSFGDYLRSGAIAARSPIMDAVRAFAAGGGHVLGVCNGFQILCEAGLLPGALLRNAGLRFLAQDCDLRIERTDTPYTRLYEAGEVIRVPMAHGDGNYTAAPDVLAELEGEGRVVFRYVTNRNGSAAAIAGIASPNRRVVGLMPHPEDSVDPVIGSTHGQRLFAGIAQAFA